MIVNCRISAFSLLLLSFLNGAYGEKENDVQGVNRVESAPTDKLQGKSGVESTSSVVVSSDATAGKASLFGISAPTVLSSIFSGEKKIRGFRIGADVDEKKASQITTLLMAISRMKDVREGISKITDSKYAAFTDTVKRILGRLDSGSTIEITADDMKANEGYLNTKELLEIFGDMEESLGSDEAVKKQVQLIAEGTQPISGMTISASRRGTTNLVTQLKNYLQSSRVQVVNTPQFFGLVNNYFPRPEVDSEFDLEAYMKEYGRSKYKLDMFVAFEASKYTLYFKDEESGWSVLRDGAVTAVSNLNPNEMPADVLPHIVFYRRAEEAKDYITPATSRGVFTQITSQNSSVGNDFMTFLLTIFRMDNVKEALAAQSAKTRDFEAINDFISDVSSGKGSATLTTEMLSKIGYSGGEFDCIGALKRLMSALTDSEKVQMMLTSKRPVLKSSFEVNDMTGLATPATYIRKIYDAGVKFNRLTQHLLFENQVGEKFRIDRALDMEFYVLNALKPAKYSLDMVVAKNSNNEHILYYREVDKWFVFQGQTSTESPDFIFNMIQSPALVIYRKLD